MDEVVQARRNSNRAAMPVIAGFVDELRELGLAPKVIFAREGGVTVGKRQRYENEFDIPNGYLKEASRAPGRKG